MVINNFTILWINYPTSLVFMRIFCDYQLWRNRLRQSIKAVLSSVFSRFYQYRRVFSYTLIRKNIVFVRDARNIFSQLEDPWEYIQRTVIWEANWFISSFHSANFQWDRDTCFVANNVSFVRIWKLVAQS